ncbi:MAG: flagellar motor switch protein FliG, partial [Rariglobus sp.]
MPATAEAPVASVTPADYAKFSRQQKLALFLIVIGAEAAGGVLKQFDDAEVEVLCREMSQFTIVPDALARQVLEEFSPIIGQSVASTLGGFDYARSTLERARSDHKASAILSRVGGSSSGSATGLIREIAEMEGRQIFNLIRNEQPQTISFLLSYLDKEKASQVFKFFTPELREDIAERLGTIDSTSTELVGKIVRNLGRHIDQKSRPNFHQSGGVRAVADLFNGMGKDDTKNLLLRLEERNAPL